MNDEIIYHKTAYDYFSLKKLLEKIGMRDIKEYNWEEKSARSHTNQSEFPGRFPASRQGKEKEDARFSMSIYLTIVL